MEHPDDMMTHIQANDDNLRQNLSISTISGGSTSGVYHM
jgi:hypothetical protein